MIAKSASSYRVFRDLRSVLQTTRHHFISRMKQCSVDHRCSNFDIVTPKTVSKSLPVPPNILRPPYVSTTPGKDACPEFIEIQTSEQISGVRNACILARKILNLTSDQLQIGMTTDEIDHVVHRLCIDNNSYPSPLGYYGFPKSVCTSVNNVACHGIPDSRPLQNGDIINIDVTVYVNGYHGDLSETYLIGEVDKRGRDLVNTTRQCLLEGISVCQPGVLFSEIGRRISEVASEDGFDVIPEFCGHGIGTYFHGHPDIFHIDLVCEMRMKENMVFTIEPVICDGNPEIKILSDGWTAVTKDNSRSAQFEHCIVITQHGADILTQ